MLPDIVTHEVQHVRDVAYGDPDGPRREGGPGDRIFTAVDAESLGGEGRGAGEGDEVVAGDDEVRARDVESDVAIEVVNGRPGEVAARLDIAQPAAAHEVLAQREVVVAIEPMRHVGGVEDRVHMILQMGVEAAPDGRHGIDNTAKVLVADEGGAACGPVEGEVHVPQKIDHLLIRRTLVGHEIVVVPEGVHVAHPEEAHQRVGAHPLIPVRGEARLRFERRVSQAPAFGKGDQPAVVVLIAMVLENEGVAVSFLVVADVGNIQPLHVVGCRQLVAIGIGIHEVVDQLELKQRSIASILKGRLHELVFIAGREDGLAGLRAPRSDDAAEVGLGHGHTSPERHVPEQNLLTLRASAVRTIDQHHWMHTAEKVIRLEHQMESNPRCIVAPVLAALEMHRRVVVGAALVEDHGARQQVVAHHVGVGMEERRVGGREDDADVVGEGEIRLAVGDRVEGTRGRPGGGKCRNRTQAIHRAHVELHDGGGSKGRDGSAVEAARLQGHGRAGPRAAIGRPPDFAVGDALSILRRHAHGDGTGRRRNDRRVLELGEGRSDVGRVGGVPRAGGSVKRGRGQRSRTRDAIEEEAGVHQVVPRDVPGPEGDFVKGAVQDRAPGGKRRLDVIVHVLLRSGRHEAQDVIAGVIRIKNNAAADVIAKGAPPGQAVLEVAIGDHLNGTTGRRLDHAEVINPCLAIAQHSEDEIPPGGILTRRGAGRRNHAIAVGLPGSFARLGAGSPGFGLAVVGIRVAQFETGAAAIRIRGPASAVEVVDLIGGIAAGVAQDDFIPAPPQLPAEVPHDGDGRIEGPQIRRVLRHDEVAAGRNGLAEEAIADAAAEFPVGEIHRVGALVVKLQPGFQ